MINVILQFLELDLVINNMSAKFYQTIPNGLRVKFHLFSEFEPRQNLDQSQMSFGGARWLSGRVSDSGAIGPGFETYRRRVVSLSKTLYSPKVLVNYPGSDGSVPT